MSKRERDYIFEALQGAWGAKEPLTTFQRGRINKATQALRVKLSNTEKSAKEIAARAYRHRMLWPKAVVTPTSLATHWDSLGLIKSLYDRQKVGWEREERERLAEEEDTRKRNVDFVKRRDLARYIMGEHDEDAVEGALDQVCNRFSAGLLNSFGGRAGIRYSHAVDIAEILQPGEIERRMKGTK